ncbi:MAG: hypothetical protein HYX37_13630 [Rhizobiales bacterium]|nr:hypothetical protein [Hyphomicrobiales bacterium]
MAEDLTPTAGETPNSAEDDEPTVQDILDARDAAIAVIDAQIAATEALQTGGVDPIDPALKKLRAKRTEIEKLTTAAIAASSELAMAIKAMKKATENLAETAKAMTTVTSTRNHN